MNKKTIEERVEAFDKKYIEHTDDGPIVHFSDASWSEATSHDPNDPDITEYFHQALTELEAQVREEERERMLEICEKWRREFNKNPEAYADIEAIGRIVREINPKT